ncbi:endonuclease/exonuclease/phosphatase family protein [Pseudahrensia aquimaris]|uniref:Endonuclease/exonuclease/phosphatase family protein n=1 Tax=Pseudahrensia aquimaris TaxID=744461 RepID=A0ABW3FGV3_9HYPH
MIWILALIAFACALTTLAGFFPLPHGLLRIFDFPRLQNAFIAAAGLITTLLLVEASVLRTLVLLAFAFTMAVQAYAILRFTPLWKSRSHAFDGDPECVPTASFFVSNVKMGNRQYEKVRERMAEANADICVFIETDADWIEGLYVDSERYPFSVSHPMDNGYGMHLVSRYRIIKHEVLFRLNEEVPSFDLMVEHPSGPRFRLITVHPEPPIATRDTVGRDAELALIGKEVRDYGEPLIVTGDLNDVAWSHSTRRFKRISKLLDPREGRGMFNTFHADYFFLRWPLDHAFHSPHFKLIAIKRMAHIGSDHFPMYYRLALTDTQKPKRENSEATAQDFEEADELIVEEKQRDRRPIGTDWEN